MEVVRGLVSPTPFMGSCVLFIIVPSSKSQMQLKRTNLNCVKSTQVVKSFFLTWLDSFDFADKELKYGTMDKKITA